MRNWTFLFLSVAQSLLTAFLAADDGLEETYNPCSLVPITTVKWRLVEEEEDVFFFALLLPISGIL
jgi:hypothetical protein